MTSESAGVGRRWKITGAIVGVLVGLIVTGNEDLYEALGLGPQLRSAYQLLGAIGGGYLGAAVGKLLDRRRFQRQGLGSREEGLPRVDNPAEPGAAPDRRGT